MAADSQLIIMNETFKKERNYGTLKKFKSTSIPISDMKLWTPHPSPQYYTLPADIVTDEAESCSFTLFLHGPPQSGLSGVSHRVSLIKDDQLKSWYRFATRGSEIVISLIKHKR